MSSASQYSRAAANQWRDPPERVQISPEDMPPRNFWKPIVERIRPGVVRIIPGDIRHTG